MSSIPRLLCCYNSPMDKIKINITKSKFNFIPVNKDIFSQKIDVSLSLALNFTEKHFSCFEHIRLKLIHSMQYSSKYPFELIHKHKLNNCTKNTKKNLEKFDLMINIYLFAKTYLLTVASNWTSEIPGQILIFPLGIIS